MIPRVIAAVLSLALAACSRGEEGAASAPRQDVRDSRGSTDTAERPVVLFLGTSLTAGLGLSPEEAYPALVQRKLDSAALAWQAVNAGLSGETSAGALRRLEWLLKGPVRIVVVETGANDGLRGLDVDSTRANLEAIIGRIRAHDSTIAIVLAGMEAPPNLGPRFTARFRAIFAELARRHGLALIPFLLEGVGGIDSLNQSDGIHPNSRGQEIVAATVWRTLEPVLRRLAMPRTAR